MGRLKMVDYFDIDDLLTDEERAIKKSVREFVENEFLPDIDKYYHDAEFPSDMPEKLGDLDLLGPTIEGYGCAGVGDVAMGLIKQELERGDSGLRSFATVQGELSMYSIYRFGSEEQKEKFLPDLAKGKKIGCFGLTEPEHGSNPGGMDTKAEKDGDEWIINGNKQWITNGGIADIAIVWAKTDEGIRGFIVEKNRDGFTQNEQKDKISMRASVTGELSLMDCRIPKENILPGTEGLVSALQCLNQARFGIVWGAVGAASACYEEALDYAKERKQFGNPIASYQLTQRKLVNMLTEITKGQLLAYRLGRLKEEGKIKYPQISVAKRNNVAMARDIALSARSILGANGITTDYASLRHAVNLESLYTYEGTNEIHTLIIGKDITGNSAFL